MRHYIGVVAAGALVKAAASLKESHRFFIVSKFDFVNRDIKVLSA